jgi:hypothetical protein
MSYLLLGPGQVRVTVAQAIRNLNSELSLRKTGGRSDLCSGMMLIARNHCDCLNGYLIAARCLLSIRCCPGLLLATRLTGLA